MTALLEQYVTSFFKGEHAQTTNILLDGTSKITCSLYSIMTSFIVKECVLITVLVALYLYAYVKFIICSINIKYGKERAWLGWQELHWDGKELWCTHAHNTCSKLQSQYNTPSIVLGLQFAACVMCMCAPQFQSPFIHVEM